MDIELVEPSFGVNNFRKPLIYEGEEALVKTVLTVLFAKPGSYPSIPELGIYIQQYRYNKFTDINVEAFKAKLSYQCSILSEAISEGIIDIKIGYLDKEKIEPVLLIVIKRYLENTSQEILLGIKSDGENISYNYILYDVE